jgi:hypothetical protein
MKMKEQFYDFYPTHYIKKALWNMKYFLQNIIFGNCVSEKTKRKNYLKTEINEQKYFGKIWDILFGKRFSIFYFQFWLLLF